MGAYLKRRVVQFRRVTAQTIHEGVQYALQGSLNSGNAST